MLTSLNIILSKIWKQDRLEQVWISPRVIPQSLQCINLVDRPIVLSSVEFHCICIDASCHKLFYTLGLDDYKWCENCFRCIYSWSDVIQRLSLHYITLAFSTDGIPGIQRYQLNWDIESLPKYHQYWYHWLKIIATIHVQETRLISSRNGSRSMPM